MRKRIILHIGTHKTGSSALQTLFEAKRSRLAEHGICYPSTAREPHPNLPKHTALCHAAIREPDKFAGEIDLMVREADAAGCDTILISEEGFSEAAYEKFAIFAPLAEAFEIEVYCYLRRQDQFIESLWNQYTKEGREARPIAAFSAAPNVRRRGDYPRLLDFWSGIGRVHAAEYTAARDQGISAHFSTWAGLPVLGDTNAVNPSLGMNAALLRCWFNGLNLKPSKPILAAMRGDLRREALGATLRQRLLADFAAINADLAARFGVRFPDGMPEERPGPLTSPEPEFLVRLLAAVAPQRAAPERAAPDGWQITAQDLHEAAAVLRGTRPELAARLTAQALRLRPGGPALVEAQAEIPGSVAAMRKTD